MKRKGRKIQALPTQEHRFSKGDLQALLHFQLCHVCLYLNESSEAITDCKKCGEPFQPPLDPHADEDIQSVMSSDPFEDWDDDNESRQEVQAEEEEESSYHDTNSGLYGLRVRW